MDVEIYNNSQESDADKKSKESSGLNEHMNGVSNGYSSDKHHKSHKSDHKDKHRSKDRDRDHKKDHKSSSKDKDRHSSSSKDKDKNKEKSSSSSKDKEHSSSKEHKSSSRDKERDKDKDRSDKHKDRDKHHSSSSSKDHKSSSSSKDKDREHKSSSSRDKEKEKDKDKERSDRDKHKHSSSSSSKDKEKDRHSSSKDKDRHSSSSKHHSSSSSKDKDRKDKEKDRERSHKSEKSSSDKHKSSDDSERKRDKYPNEVIIPAKEDYKDDIKEEIREEQDPLASQDDGLDLAPNVSATSSCDYSLSAFKSEPEFDINNEQDEGNSEVSLKMEVETGSDDEVPLASRKKSPGSKRKFESEDDDDDIPLVARKKVKKEKKEKKAKKKVLSSENEDEEEYEEKPKKKKKAAVKQEIKKEVKKEIKREIKQENTSDTSPKKRKKKQEEEAEVWKWWEEEKKDDGTKWHFLEHKGPVFAPPYEPLPSNVKFFYDGKEIKLSQDAEEVAGFYARMLDHDYTTKEAFNNNFFKDWRKCMTEKEKSKITDLKKCNFKPMHAYFMDLSEKNRNRTKEEKEELKKKNAAIQEEYGFCTIDGHKEKIGNFRIEPPGLFRGRGEHPKMGMLKRRVMPEDVLINCSKDSKIPVPPNGHKWREVRHDPNVTWLASWTENVQNQVKYVMLNPSSKLKGEKDWQKYETARRLAKSIEKIRKDYREDWKSKEMRIRQRAVAMYFIDRLALRAGNEKDEDQADTVGCCSLRVEHIELHEEKDGKEYVVVFDFLGKDSIRYYNEVPVEKRVFKNLQLFMENKAPSDDLFDRLNTSVLNKHLTELMDGLTAKVFRTYNASITLQDQLEKLTNPDDSLAEKILSYNRANRAVAILCNHQRSVPKGHEKSMEKLKEKIEQKREQIADAECQVKDAQKAAKRGSVKEKVLYEKKKKMLERMNEQLRKLEVQETDRDENKTIALGTSKLNYLDPRISVAWCKKNDVPIEKIYNKTQRDKFRWAIDMAGPDYIF